MANSVIGITLNPELESESDFEEEEMHSMFFHINGHRSKNMERLRKTWKICGCQQEEQDCSHRRY
jgi:hypothetical protein